ncbi:MAG: flagellar protein FlbD [Bdellovibrionaceae bacterium]|jgi:flagellar protein FlbD|nr:flagellar protein FlbD [Pseudobdellovibrionaceae bacterium]
MIEIHKLNGQVALINDERINLIESKPDTFITFDNGDTLFIKESLSDIKEKIMSYKKEIFTK